MTPDEALTTLKMLAALGDAPTVTGDDLQELHCHADDLVAEFLIDNGFAELGKVYQNMRKTYPGE